MKRINDLKTPHFKDDHWGRENKEITEKAIKRLKELDKRNPRVFGAGKIRVNHRGCYFDYSPHTGRWVYTRSAGRRRWNKSYSVDDFYKKMDAFMDWYDDNVKGKQKERLTDEEKIESEKKGEAITAAVYNMNKMTLKRWKNWGKRWICVHNVLQENKIITYINGTERFIQVN